MPCSFRCRRTRRSSSLSKGPARLMAKDMGLLLADAGKLGVPMASMAATTQLFALTTVAHADEDYAAAILTMEQLAEAPAKNS